MAQYHGVASIVLCILTYAYHTAKQANILKEKLPQTKGSLMEARCCYEVG